MDVIYYEDSAGKVPVRDFIDCLEPKMKAKVFARLSLLETYGARLPMPYAKHVGDGIYELSTPQGSNITRLLYFFFSGDRAIVTNGFLKKTMRTPRREIEKAKKMRSDWKERHE